MLLSSKRLLFSSLQSAAGSIATTAQLAGLVKLRATVVVVVVVVVAAGVVVVVMRH